MPHLPRFERTSVAVVVRLHEGQAQPLVFLQGTLVREAPVNGAHHVGLLIAVVHGGFGHVDGFPGARKERRSALHWRFSSRTSLQVEFGAKSGAVPAVILSKEFPNLGSELGVGTMPLFTHLPQPSSCSIHSLDLTREQKKKSRGEEKVELERLITLAHHSYLLSFPFALVPCSFSNPGKRGRNSRDSFHNKG